jgi:RNA polymerase sigma-70 factor, ECF subfamily
MSETTTLSRHPITPGDSSPTGEAATDMVLVKRFQAGDESAFTEIMRRHYNRVYATAQQALHNMADAEDTAQDTFIRAYRGLANFRGDASLSTWLHRIALNLARNRYWYFFRRRRQDMLSLDNREGAAEHGTYVLAERLAAQTPAPHTEVIQNEFISMTAACIQRLDEGSREILTMRGLLDLSYEEISEVLHIGIGTVKSRLARAREKLRKQIRLVCPTFDGRAELSADDFFEPARPIPHSALVA